MAHKTKTNQLPWPIIIRLGLLALVRPIVRILGDAFDYNVPSAVTLLITAAIAIVWMGTVIKLKLKNPIVVLALSGGVYAVSSILLAVVIQLLVPELSDEEAKIPILLTAGLMASLIFNVIYGAFLGWVAQTVDKLSQ